MPQKRELINLTIINNSSCNLTIPLFQNNVASINATTKYSWDITTADLSCGTGTLVVNSISYNLTFAPTLSGLLSSLNALNFGLFCSEVIGGDLFIYTIDDTNIYGNFDPCPSASTTTTTTTLPVTSTTTTTTTLPVTSTTTTTTLPVTSTTTTTTLPVTSTTTTTTLPVTSTTTTTTLPVTSTTTTTTLPPETSTTTTTTTTLGVLASFEGQVTANVISSGNSTADAQINVNSVPPDLINVGISQSGAGSVSITEPPTGVVQQILVEGDVVNFNAVDTVGASMTYSYRKFTTEDGTTVLQSGTAITAYAYTILASDLTKTNLKFTNIVTATSA